MEMDVGGKLVVNLSIISHLHEETINISTPKVNHRRFGILSVSDIWKKQSRNEPNEMEPKDKQNTVEIPKNESNIL